MRDGSAFRWHGGNEWTRTAAKGGRRALIHFQRIAFGSQRIAFGSRRIAIGSRRAFSLIEVLIVASILAILAGIGLVSFNYLMETARKKATIAEAREISTAVAFAHQNTGFFPKLNYLLENLLPAFANPGDVSLLGNNADGVVWPKWVTPNGDDQVHNGFDYIGRVSASAPRADDSTFRTYSRRIADAWDGPYWALSPTSKSRMEGPSGYIEMEIPREDGAPAPTDGVKCVVRRWPMDQYGNPYVLYLLEQTKPKDDGTAQDGTINNVRFLKNPTDEPSFAAAVVSYGQDELPGLLLGPPGSAEETRKQGQLLYVEISQHHRYRMLQPGDYDLPAGNQRLIGFSEQRFGDKNLIGVTDSAAYLANPPSPLKPGTFSSDDIIIEF